jgi:hypothetical protein
MLFSRYLLKMSLRFAQTKETSLLQVQPTFLSHFNPHSPLAVEEFLTTAMDSRNYPQCWRNLDEYASTMHEYASTMLSQTVL